MRGLVPDLPSGVPIAQRLPGVYQEEELTSRFVAAFDDALAPIIATLDGLPGYVDPWLAPADFLDWLAGWVGIEVDETWTLAQRRAIVAGAAAWHRRRGTARGIADAVRLSAAEGCEVEVVDTGATTWSSTPGGDIPGSSPPQVTVSVRVASAQDAEQVDVRRVEAVVTSVKPAHVRHTVEVVVEKPEPVLDVDVALESGEDQEGEE